MLCAITPSDSTLLALIREALAAYPGDTAIMTRQEYEQRMSDAMAPPLLFDGATPLRNRHERRVSAATTRKARR